MDDSLAVEGQFRRELVPPAVGPLSSLAGGVKTATRETLEPTGVWVVLTTASEAEGRKKNNDDIN